MTETPSVNAATTSVPLRLRVGARVAVRALRWLGAERASAEVRRAGRRFTGCADRHAVWIGGRRVHLWSVSSAELRRGCSLDEPEGRDARDAPPAAPALHLIPLHPTVSPVAADPEYASERDPLVLGAVQAFCVTRALLRRQPIDPTALAFALRGLDFAEAALLLLDDERRARWAREALT